MSTLTHNAHSLVAKALPPSSTSQHGETKNSSIPGQYEESQIVEGNTSQAKDPTPIPSGIQSLSTEILLNIVSRIDDIPSIVCFALATKRYYHLTLDHFKVRRLTQICPRNVRDPFLPELRRYAYNKSYKRSFCLYNRSKPGNYCWMPSARSKSKGHVPKLLYGLNVEGVLSFVQWTTWVADGHPDAVFVDAVLCDTLGVRFNTHLGILWFTEWEVRYLKGRHRQSREDLVLEGMLGEGLRRVEAGKQQESMGGGLALSLFVLVAGTVALIALRCLVPWLGGLRSNIAAWHRTMGSVDVAVGLTFGLATGLAVISTVFLAVESCWGWIRRLTVRQ